ncbi:LamG domain-containing protein [Luteolibacter ambystomatis]|uniref:LamG domain-containing protein n=1 Tax=Luteolibacter ambystomatis TaxID=2824561 RepID=A0A975IZV6_9BACT|nr:LamG domain-containing protein [Luteolibacter ambystomatis]QUE50370.1 LamG domain-containing protein [Luteolibacter ambystomatis]
MKLRSIALLGSVLLSSQAHAAVTTGLVAYYDFQTAASGGVITNRAQAVGSDYAGPFTNATVFGTSPTSGFSGDAAFNSTGATGAGNVSNRSTLLVGNAANFTHTGTDTIRTGLGTSVLGQSYSISAWFYAAIDPNQAASQRYFVLEDGTDTAQFDLSYGSQSANANAANLAMWTYNNGLTNATVQGNVSTNSWHQVVQTVTPNGANSTVTVYIDGTLFGSYTTNNGQPSFTDINIGNARDGQSRAWDGMIDEVAIYNRTLTQSDVTELRNLGLAGLAVPEPSAAILGGLGSLLLLRRRRG